MMKIQGIDDPKSYKTNIKDLLPVLLGGIVAMLSTCLILSEVLYIAILSSNDFKNIKPITIFATFSFEVLGTNLMMGSILWSYFDTVKNFLGAFKDAKKQKEHENSENTSPFTFGDTSSQSTSVPAQSLSYNIT